MVGYVSFDKPTLVALRDGIAKAKAEGKDKFEFQGHEVLVKYAEYMAEFVELGMGMKTKASNEREGKR